MRISIVTTTINNEQTFSPQYYSNFSKFGVKLDDVSFIIVGDNKTPPLSNTKENWMPKRQDKWLKDHFPTKYGKIKKLIVPNNDMRRRNFGYLRALELDADYIITIDDDNYPLANHNWLSLHIHALNQVWTKGYGSANHIINPCRHLESNHDCWSRGYPFSSLYEYSYPSLTNFSQRKVVLNMGLWIGKPDVDSFTNLLYPDLHSKRYIHDSSICVAPYNYFPINTQNTCFSKELSIFHNLYMDSSLFHRFDDIWMGIICQRLAYAMGNVMSFGLPIVDHKRNVHDYIKDFRTEFVGLALNQSFWDTIMNMEVDSKKYKDGFLEIVEKLCKSNFYFCNPIIQKFLNKMLDSSRLWVELIERL